MLNSVTLFLNFSHYVTNSMNKRAYTKCFPEIPPIGEANIQSLAIVSEKRKLYFASILL